MRDLNQKFFEDFCDLKKLEPSALKALQETARRGETLAVALSGGSDSVFLLCLALQICPPQKLVAFHFNHKVRKNADIDEEFVREFCKECKVKLIACQRKEALKKITEAELRSLREAFFESAAREAGVKKILQGHIKSDVAESMLMRLMRGASLEGLCAPRPISKRRGLAFIRPLLTLNKSDTQKILRAKGVEWREDESNFQCDFLRNKLRNIAIPEILKIENIDFFRACLRSRALLEEDADFIEKALENSILEESESSIALKPGALGHRALLRRAAQRILSRCNLEPRAAAVDKFLDLCAEESDAKLEAGSKILRFSRGEARLFLSEKSAKKIEAQKLFCGKNRLSDGSKIIVEQIKISDSEYEKIRSGFYPEAKFAHIKSAEDLYVRPREKGDAYAPIGAKSPRPLKDLMSAKKTPILKRKSLPLVCSKGQIVWAPTLAPAESFKIERNCDAIRLTYIERS